MRKFFKGNNLSYSIRIRLSMIYIVRFETFIIVKFVAEQENLRLIV